MLQTPVKGIARKRWSTAIASLGLVAAWILMYRMLQPMSQFFTYSVFQLPRGSSLGSAIEFFLFEVPKVLLLLVIIVFIVGIIRTFFNPAPPARSWRVSGNS